MKTIFVRTVYTAAIGLTVICAGIIVFKLLFWGPCTPDPRGSICTVDSWSIAGLAATVLGVAATILAILGAFAVAYWWAELDNRVSKQVINLFEKQKTDIDRQTNDLLGGQRKKLEDLGQQIARSRSELEYVQELANNIIELTLSVAAINPPWMLEPWAQDITDKFKTPLAAKQMIFAYTKIVEGLLSSQSAGLENFKEQLNQQNAPALDLHYYLEQAKRWMQRIKDHYKGVSEEAIPASGERLVFQEPNTLKLSRERIEEYERKVDTWEQSKTGNSPDSEASS